MQICAIGSRFPRNGFHIALHTTEHLTSVAEDQQPRYYRRLDLWPIDGPGEEEELIYSISGQWDRTKVKMFEVQSEVLRGRGSPPSSLPDDEPLLSSS